MSNIFGLSIFFVTDILLYLLQGGHKTSSLTPQKKQKKWKKHLKNENFEKKVGFFPFSTHPASLKKNVIFGHFSGGEGEAAKCYFLDLKIILNDFVLSQWIKYDSTLF